MAVAAGVPVQEAVASLPLLLLSPSCLPFLFGSAISPLPSLAAACLAQQQCRFRGHACCHRLMNQLSGQCQSQTDDNKIAAPFPPLSKLSTSPAPPPSKS